MRKVKMSLAYLMNDIFTFALGSIVPLLLLYFFLLSHSLSTAYCMWLVETTVASTEEETFILVKTRNKQRE